VAGAAQASVARASRDTQVVAFWDAMLPRGEVGAERGAPPLLVVMPAGASAAAARRGALPPPPPPPPPHDAVVATALLRSYLRPAVAHIVGASARAQAVKGLFTAGPVRSAAYLLAKLRKFAAVVFAGTALRRVG
jgi:hypothetical protein